MLETQIVLAPRHWKPWEPKQLCDFLEVIIDPKLIKFRERFIRNTVTGLAFQHMRKSELKAYANNCQSSDDKKDYKLLLKAKRYLYLASEILQYYEDAIRIPE